MHVSKLCRSLIWKGFWSDNGLWFDLSYNWSPVELDGTPCSVYYDPQFLQHIQQAYLYVDLETFAYRYHVDPHTRCVHTFWDNIRLSLPSLRSIVLIHSLREDGTGPTIENGRDTYVYDILKAAPIHLGPVLIGRRQPHGMTGTFHGLNKDLTSLQQMTLSIPPLVLPPARQLPAGIFADYSRMKELAFIADAEIAGANDLAWYLSPFPTGTSSSSSPEAQIFCQNLTCSARMTSLGLQLHRKNRHDSRHGRALSAPPHLSQVVNAKRTRAARNLALAKQLWLKIRQQLCIKCESTRDHEDFREFDRMIKKAYGTMYGYPESIEIEFWTYFNPSLEAYYPLVEGDTHENSACINDTVAKSSWVDNEFQLDVLSTETVHRYDAFWNKAGFIDYKDQ
jgi:hypothetical protein